jgi:hypothetical protein
MAAHGEAPAANVDISRPPEGRIPWPLSPLLGAHGCNVSPRGTCRLTPLPSEPGGFAGRSDRRTRAFSRWHDCSRRLQGRDPLSGAGFTLLPPPFFSRGSEPGAA